MLAHNPKLILPLCLLLFFACKKEEQQPQPEPKTFQVNFQNELNELQTQAAAWLSNELGEVVAFRWLEGNDTTQLVLPNFDEKLPAPNLTVARFIIVANGQGKDTTLNLNTYTGVKNGSTLHLRNLEFRKTTILRLTFPDVQSVDTIIVPDALTYSRPGWWNNYYGEYRCRHSGNIWLRLKINGEKNWRYLFFKNVDADDVAVQVPTQILPIEDYPRPIQLPFDAAWQYRVDGILDFEKKKFLPLGDLERAPGGARPVFDTLNVFQPVTFDPVAPPNVGYSGFLLTLAGRDLNGNGYFLEDLFQKLPETVPSADFKVEPLSISNNQSAGTRCTGDFDALVFSRKKSNPTSTVTWESWHQPAASVSFRLPAVPVDFAKVFPTLPNYLFDGRPRARAESFRNLSSFEAVLNQIFDEKDAHWRAAAGYLGIDAEL